MKPYELSVTEAVNAIQRGELSSVELVTSLFERIEAIEPSIQAWETIDREGALAAARTIEQAVKDGKRGVLDGVPIGVKDIFDVAGLPTTGSFAPRRNTIAASDSAAVARLRASGAVVVGKTVTTQFAYVDPPRTRNPWNLARTTGGSSSGSGAAVAARMVPAALGSQTGGSVLRPAAYCGVVGLKPTYGRISRIGVLPLAWSLDHVGVLCRTVQDAALLLQILAGHDPRDPGSCDEPVAQYVAVVGREPVAPRLGMVEDFLEAAQPEEREHFVTAARQLERAGAEVRPLRLPSGLRLMVAVHHLTMQTEAATVHAASLNAHLDDYAPRLRAYVEVGQIIPAAAYLHAQRLRRRFRAEVDALLAKVDCLLMPTVSGPAPGPETTGDPSFQAPWSLLGLPAITVPSGLSTEGLPMGAQLVAPRFAEEKLLAAARFVEAALGPLPAPTVLGLA